MQNSMPRSVGRCGVLLLTLLLIPPCVASEAPAAQLRSRAANALRSGTAAATNENTAHPPQQPTDASEAEKQTAANSVSANEKEPASGEAAEDSATIEQLEGELHTAEKQLDELRKSGASEEAPATEGQATPGERLRLLQQLKDNLQLRIASLNRLGKAREALATAEKELADFQHHGLSDTPPHDVKLLDTFRDQLATIDREAESADATIDTLNATVKHAEKQQKEAEQNRRQLRDKLAAAEDTAREALQSQLEMAQLQQRITEQEVQLAETQRARARIDRQTIDVRKQLGAAKIAAVGDQVEFTRKQLREYLSDIDGRRDRIEDELAALRRTEQADHARVADARESLAKARGEDAIRAGTETLAAREATERMVSAGVELLQERLNALEKFKTLWERRFALTQDPTDDQLTEWRDATAETIDEIERKRDELEQRLEKLRTAKLDLENRLATPDISPADKRELQAQLAALKRHEETEVGFLATLVEINRMAGRLSDELQSKRQLESWRHYWPRAWSAAQKYWNSELFDVDDQGFRTGDVVQATIVFFVALCVAWVARFLIRRHVLGFLRARADASKLVVDGALLAVLQQTKQTFVVLLAAYLAVSTLPLSSGLQSALNKIALIALTVQAALWVSGVMRGIIENGKRRRAAADPSATSAFGLLKFFSQVAIWSAALLLILSNLDYQIGPLLAGLGVGGVAVAFALQHILSDIFCSIAIVLDKPFVIGDFIVVGDMMGSVENIGIKTTRLRSLGGELLVFSNADLIGSRIRNYKQMNERRVVFALGVLYETTVDQLQHIPAIVRTIIEDIPKTRFDRAHFKNFGDFSLNFEVVYFVLSPDFNVYMDIQQDINLQIFEKFAQEGISFAYPTQEIILRPNSAVAST